MPRNPDNLLARGPKSLTPGPRRKNKYGARPSGRYASTKEQQRAAILRLLQAAGDISNLREQVSYELIPAQYALDDKGRKITPALERSCRYIADFVYTDNHTGLTVVEDTKGVRTPQYIIKRKLMLFRHGIRIREI